MSNPFFDHPILNTPYDSPSRHWELKEDGQPSENIINTRRRAKFITPIPQPRKRKRKEATPEIDFGEQPKLDSTDQQYDLESNINEIRSLVTAWRNSSNSAWGVTPYTARLLDHWRNYRFNSVRPFLVIL